MNRTYNIYFDTPSHLPLHDRRLIDEAHRQRWEDIDADAAETAEGREVLGAIRSRKYHYDEARCGMI
jgi:hypothetical protein